MPIEPLNTIPVQQFMQRVKTADKAKAKEVKLSLDEAKTLALTLGQVMARLEGDLERFVYEAGQGNDEVISVEIGNKPGW